MTWLDIWKTGFEGISLHCQCPHKISMTLKTNYIIMALDCGNEHAGINFHILSHKVLEK